MADDSELERRVRERAFQIWIEEGQPLGRDREHWERARKEIGGENGASRQHPTLAPAEPIGEIKYAQPALVDRGEGQAPEENK